MLLENCCSEKRCLETMSGSRANDAAKSAHRKARRLGVVWKIIQPSLNCCGSPKLVDDPSLGWSQSQPRRFDFACVGKSIGEFD